MPQLLTLNVGSSSLKAALFTLDDEGERSIASAHVDRIGDERSSRGRRKWSHANPQAGEWPMNNCE
jgi:acetate kinase